MKSFARNVEFAANASYLGRYLDLPLLQLLVRHGERDVFRHGFVVDDALEDFLKSRRVSDVGPNGVRPRASAAGPYKFGCGPKPRGPESSGWSGNGLTVCFRFRHRLFVFQQGVILGRDRPRGLDTRVFPNRRCPIV